MNGVIFSSWAGKIIDNRGQDTAKSTGVEDLELPQTYNGYQIGAFVSWQGLVVTDDRVNIIDAARSYLEEAQKLSCGECTVGYSGIRVMLGIMTRILNGAGVESDIELLQRLGSGIKENAKCSFCATAVVPILDTIEYFREEYLSLMTDEKAVPEATYLTRVSAPCIEACPAHQDVPGYIELIRNRRYDEALALIRETNCLPGVTGRACFAFCEASCVRGETDNPIAIRALKRVPADYEESSGLKPKLEKAKNNGIKVAVIGAGPAGLACGYRLALLGYQVTVYDEQSQAGGMALAGIPAFRLPRKTIGREAEIIQKAGIEFKLNTRVGRDVTLGSLHNDGFKAIFIATGAYSSRKLGIEGEDGGVVEGVGFLCDVNLGKKIAAKGRVVIIGGGNVAVDCARTCLRLGFKEVTIVYRRSRDEMPGGKEEIADAEKEGVKIHFLAAPVKIITQNDKVTGVECIAMKLGEPDASGRKRPVPVPGSEFTVATDMVLSAIGEKPDLSFLSEADQIEITDDGNIKIAPDTCRTSRAGVFSGGDCVTGPATLIEAIAAGNRAASNIDQYLKSEKPIKSEADIIADLVHNVNLSGQREKVVVAKMERCSPQQLAVKDRLKDFAEVESVFTDGNAIKEAERCLRCYRVMLLAVNKGNHQDSGIKG